MLDTKFHPFDKEETSGIVYVYVNRRLTIHEIADVLRDHFPYTRGNKINSPYDCTGKSFSNRVRLKRTKTRTLISQYVGTDI